jgi:hypothetical protein
VTCRKFEPDNRPSSVKLVNFILDLIDEMQLVYNWAAEPDDLVPYLHAHPTQNEA